MKLAGLILKLSVANVWIRYIVQLSTTVDEDGNEVPADSGPIGLIPDL